MYYVLFFQRYKIGIIREITMNYLTEVCITPV